MQPNATHMNDTTKKKFPSSNSLRLPVSNCEYRGTNHILNLALSWRIKNDKWIRIQTQHQVEFLTKIARWCKKMKEKETHRLQHSNTVVPSDEFLLISVCFNRLLLPFSVSFYLRCSPSWVLLFVLLLGMRRLGKIDGAGFSLPVLYWKVDRRYFYYRKGRILYLLHGCYRLKNEVFWVFVMELLEDCFY